MRRSCDLFDERELERLDMANREGFLKLRDVIAERVGRLYPGIEVYAAMMKEDPDDIRQGCSAWGNRGPTISEIEEHALANGVEIEFRYRPLKRKS